MIRWLLLMSPSLSGWLNHLIIITLFKILRYFYSLFMTTMTPHIETLHLISATQNEIMSLTWIFYHTCQAGLEIHLDFSSW